MSPRALRRFLGAYAGFLVVLGLSLRAWFALSVPPAEVVVVSVWKEGTRVGREVLVAGATPKALPAPPGSVIAEEVVVGEAPLSMRSFLFTLGLVPGRDGVKAELDGKTAYATVDDLDALQAYDHANVIAEVGFGWGTHRPSVLHVLSEQLGVPPRELVDRATFRRVRFESRPSRTSIAPPAPSAAPSANLGIALAGPAPEPTRLRPRRITDDNLTRELVTDAVQEGATHLARNVDADGNYRYLIESPTNKTLVGYNWPRHSGATFFLAQAAELLDDPFIRHAALRAGARLRDSMTRKCGAHECISEDEPLAELGSTALALIAYTEIVRTGADGAYRPAITELAAFLRSQQRPDGEFMHQFDRQAKTPIDVQFLYYSGEATLALARAHTITGDPRDLEAARRGLARLSGAGWSFFGSRYYFSEEHWTCQAVAELWDRAPDAAALDFCSRWHEYQRRLQQDADETPFDADGAFGFGPIVTPRVTPASSRGEAAGALLDVLVRERKNGRPGRSAEVPLVERELRRALAFVLRNQFRPGPVHLFAEPVAVRGAVTGSPVDWQLRIDYVQHAGSMMIRWLHVDAMRDGQASTN